MNSKQIGIMAVVVITTAIVIFIFAHNYKDSKKTIVSAETTETAVETEDISCPLDEKTEQHFKNASYITVERVLSTAIDSGDDYEMKYDAYCISDVDLEKQSDDTADYTEALADEFSENQIQKADFYDAFGFDYAGFDGYEILEQLLLENGFEDKWEDVSFDEETNELTGQKLYVFQNADSTIDQLLDGQEYDEIISSKVYYQTGETSDGITYPDCFVANVIYSVGDKTVTKNLYLQVTVNR